MNNKSVNSIHWSFWLISAIMLIWNVMGSMNFLWQMLADADALAALSETHRSIIEGRPVWATAGFAIGVIVGAFGCLLLLLRKLAAFYLFVISLLGIILTMIHTVYVANMLIEFSFIEIVIMIVMPLVVASFLIWYSKWALKKSWIS